MFCVFCLTNTGFMQSYSLGSLKFVARLCCILLYSVIFFVAALPHKHRVCLTNIGWSKGWGSSESTRLPPIWPGFKSRRRLHMGVEFVAGSLLSYERFFSGYSGFLLSSKTNTSKFQFDLECMDTFKRVHMKSSVLRG